MAGSPKQAAAGGLKIQTEEDWLLEIVQICNAELHG